MRESERDPVRHVALPAIRNAEDRALLQAMFNAVDTCEGEGTCPAEVLDRLDAGLRSRSEVVRSRAATWLHQLAFRHPSAADRLRRLASVGPATARLSLVQSIGFNDVSNEPLEREILAAALRDKLPRIKTFAADRILTRGWREMGPALDATAETMPTAAARESVLNQRRLLVDGYYLRPPSPAERRASIVVRSNSGTTMFAVPPEVAESLGYAEVARRTRLRSDWPLPAHEPAGRSWDPVPDPIDLAKNVGLDPDLVAARLAFAEFEADGRASLAAANKLLAVMEGESPEARQCAAAWLVHIGTTDAEVIAMIRHGSAKWRAASRLALIQAIHSSDVLLADFLVDLVGQGLRDADPMIRRMAGVQVQYRELRSLLPDLTQAAADEPDPTTAASLAENVAFLRDGYIVKPLPRKRYDVRVSLGRGVQQFQMPAKVADEIGFPEIARRVRARREHKGRRPLGKFWDPI